MSSDTTGSSPESKKGRNMTKKIQSCYDCGSAIPMHHTVICGMAERGSKRDLQAMFASQHWDKSEVRLTPAQQREVKAWWKKNGEAVRSGKIRGI